MKFDMSVAWREATEMISANREVLLIVAGIFFFLPNVVFALTIGGLQEAIIANPENAEQIMISAYAQWWWLLLLVTFTTIVGYIALLALLRDSGRPTVGEAIKAGVVGLLPAIGMSVILGLAFMLVVVVFVLIGAAAGAAVATILGLIAAVVAVYIAVKLSLAYPVIAIEKVMNPITVMSRSWTLTRGNSLRLFLFYALLFVAYLVVAVVIGGIIGLVASAAGQSLEGGINGIFGGILSALMTVLIVAILASAHRQLAGPSATAVSDTFE